MLDVGGTHVKCLASGQKTRVEFASGPRLTPRQMVKKVREIARGWRFEAISIGYPGVVRDGAIAVEPHNLGRGWVGFDFQAAFKCPVRIINDAAMQALGDYRGGRLLFLGLGTGLGSALIVDGAIAPLELGHLRYSKKHDYEDYLGEHGRRRLGGKKWRAKVATAAKAFRKALLPEDIVLGGGNARHLKRLPPHTRRGDNAAAFVGGFRLWEARLPGSRAH